MQVVTSVLAAFALRLGVSANHEDDAGVHPVATQFAGGKSVFLGRLPAAVVVDEPGTNTEWRVGAMTTAAQSYVPNAVSQWNTALQSTPYSIDPAKYPFHWQPSFDFSPTANVQVNVVADPNRLISQCGGAHPACNYWGLYSGTIWVDTDTDTDQDGDGTYETHTPLSSQVVQALTTHELGHSLFLNDHYNYDGTCNPSYNSIMNCSGSYWSVTGHDEDDVYGGYKPKDAPLGAAMSIVNGSTVQYSWNTPEANRHNLADYFIQRLADRNGSLIDQQWVNGNPDTGPVVGNVNYTIGTGWDSRYCLRVGGSTSIGYPGLAWLSPFAPHGCASRSVSPYPTSFVVTSHVSGSNIVLKVRNGSATTRYFQVVGPGLQSVGSCSNTYYKTISANGGMNSCTVSVSTASLYDRLAVFVWSSNTGGTLIAAISIDTDAG